MKTWSAMVLVLGVGFSGGSAAAQDPGSSLRELFQELDANMDRVIEPGEVPEAARPAFERLLRAADLDGDGSIAGSELREVLAGAVGNLPDDRMKAADRDGDGKISKDEFPGPAASFGRLDRDGDGFLDGAEASRMPQRARPDAGPAEGLARFRAADRDGDMKLSREEFPGPAELFGRLDADGDGLIDAEEAGRFARLAGAGPAGGGAPGPMFRAADRDGDGKISKAEFRGPEALFGRLDRDGDGQITREEARALTDRPGRGGAAGRPAVGAMDRDGDGKVSREEFRGPAALFDRLDRDGDGSIDKDEVESARPGRPAAGLRRPGRSAPKSEPPAGPEADTDRP